LTAQAFVVFRLEGPMAGFGAPAVGEQRPSWEVPSKSGVLGLVGAALGLERGANEAHLALSEGFALGIRVENAGEPLRDFHTAQAPGQGNLATRREELRAADLHTVLSDRRYRTDVGWTIALTRRGEAGPKLAAIAAALRRPQFNLYLGRRCCPLGSPPRPRLLEAPDVLSALQAYDGLEGRTGTRSDAPVWVDTEMAPDPRRHLERRTRRDALHHRSHWLFRDRIEVQIAPWPPAPRP
jgi:CRISPR system Cascade subunit CasD